MDSPRGRLHTMRALEDGRVEPTEPVLRHLDLCLDCRACETACPSGVPFGRLLEETRARLAPSRRGHPLERWIRRAVGLPAPVAALGAPLLGLAHRWLASRPIPGLHPAGALLASRRPVATRLPRSIPAVGETKARVGLLLGCVTRWVLGDVNAATARVLAAAGCEVVVVPGQGCCGALHLHGGDRAGARLLMGRNVRAFARAGTLDAIVVNAAGCGSAMKDAGRLLADDPELAEPAARFADRTRDVLELLAQLGLPELAGRHEGSVTCHEACHLAHAQRCPDASAPLLTGVPGTTVLPLVDAERCCGSAGIYNLLQPEVADALRDRKLDRVEETGADVVTAANPGCLLHLAAGLRSRGAAVRVLHPVQILDEALHAPRHPPQPR